MLPLLYEVSKIQNILYRTSCTVHKGNRFKVGRISSQWECSLNRHNSHLVNFLYSMCCYVKIMIKIIRLKWNNTISYPKACKHVKRQSSANISVKHSCSTWNLLCKKTMKYVIGNLEFILGKTKMVNKICVYPFPHFWKSTSIFLA